MMRLSLVGIVLGISVAAGPAVAGEPAARKTVAGETAAGRPREFSESLTDWPWLHTVPLPPSDRSAWADFVLTPEVFDRARADLGDLRLLDARSREVPYALRVRQTRDEEQSLAVRQFNEHKDSTRRAVEVSLDLGADPPEHQLLRVQTSGSDFRRRVQLEGSNSEQDWGVLVDKAWLVQFAPDSGSRVERHKVRYPPSRFRYLRLRVFADLSQPDDSPEIASVSVYHTVEVPGEYQTRPVGLGPREAVKAYGGPASAWTIDLGGEQVPCERLTFETAESDFLRPYMLEKVESSGARQVIARGEWRRRAAEPRKGLEIQFPEVTARRLRLVVVDHRNPPLSLSDVLATAAVRQVVFARSAELAGPLRLYVGRLKAEPPHYDFAANLPQVLEPPPGRTEIQTREPNPEYRPVPKPWTERWPWLVYLVLGGAATVLLVLLAALARAAIARRDASAERGADATPQIGRSGS